jgi:hypothetical protein
MAGDEAFDGTATPKGWGARGEEDRDPRQARPGCTTRICKSLLLTTGHTCTKPRGIACSGSMPVAVISTSSPV